MKGSLGLGIIPINLYSEVGLYDNTGGSLYTPPPPPVDPGNLLLETGDLILLENGNGIHLE